MACVHAPSTASLLGRMARQVVPSAFRSSPVLHFLAPGQTTSPTWAHSGTRNKHLSPLRATALSRTSHRALSTSPLRRATECVRNLQLNEDGSHMLLEITPRAAKRLSEIMRKDANPNLALRIQVESGGCHGFQYLMSLVTLPRIPVDAESTSIVSEDDIVFQFKPDDEAASVPESEGIPKIIVDPPSLDLLKGSKVDFTMELIGSQFKIVDNPFATSSCGCGTSFDIKF